VGGADTGELARSRFHHLAKVIVAQGPLLLQMGADRLKIVVRKDFGKQRAIGGAALLARVAEPCVRATGRQQRIVTAPAK